MSQVPEAAAPKARWSQLKFNDKHNTDIIIALGVSNPLIYPKGGKGEKETAFHTVVLQQPSFVSTFQEGVLGNPSLDMVLSRLSNLIFPPLASIPSQVALRRFSPQ